MIKEKLEDLLVFDIETVRITKTIADLKSNFPHLYKVWEDKKDFFRRSFPCDDLETDEEVWQAWGGMLPEFGKIVCFSSCTLKVAEDGTQSKKITSYADEDEMKILTAVTNFLKHDAMQRFTLCAHNGKKFDIPYLIKRLIINGIMPPSILPSYDTKPWEMKVLDTRDVWANNVYKSLSGLDLICASLGIPSPKDGIDGSQVGRVYYEGGLDQIKIYCEKDVSSLMDVVIHLKGLK